jgi:hypothetical protein
MVHAAEEVIRVLDDLVATLAFDVRNEADAAAVVLELGAIQPCAAGGRCSLVHACLPFLMPQERSRRIGREPVWARPRRCSFVYVALQSWF